MSYEDSPKKNEAGIDQEEKERRDNENEKANKLMGEAETPWDLRQIITDNKITLYGASQIFYPDMLVQVIDKVTDDDPNERWPITMATNAGGFRDILRGVCMKCGIEINDDEEEWRVKK